MLNIAEGILMVNQVKDLSHLNPLDLDGHSKIKPQETKDADTEAMKSEDSFDLSPTSKQLETLKTSLQDIPEVNSARVLFFKSEIELGNYQMDSAQIASKMLNNLEIA